MKKLLFLGLVLLLTTVSFAQVGIGTTTPNPSSVLDLFSTTKGLLLPRVTTVQRDAISLPATGLVIYNTTANQMQTNTGTPAAPIWTSASDTDTNIYNSNGTVPAATNRQVTLGNRVTSKLTIAPTGEEANISTLNVIGGLLGGGITAGITVSDNFTNNTQKVGLIKAPQFLNSSPPVMAFAVVNTSFENRLSIGGNASGSQANPSIIDFRVDGDNDLTTNAGVNGIVAMTIQGVTGNVGIGTLSPNASAILDLTSARKGLLLPRLTTVERDLITSPATGLVIYNTTVNLTQTNTGTPAVPVWTSGLITASNGLTATGTNVTLGGTLAAPTAINQNSNPFAFTGTGNVGIGQGPFTGVNGKLHIYEDVGTPITGVPIAQGWVKGSLILQHGDAGGASSILFRSGSNQFSDRAWIQYFDNVAIGGTESSLLEIGVADDGLGGPGVPIEYDNIAIMPSNNLGVGTRTPTSKLHVVGLRSFASDAAAGAAGLTAGAFYQTNGLGSGIFANVGVLMVKQ